MSKKPEHSADRSFISVTTPADLLLWKRQQRAAAAEQATADVSHMAAESARDIDRLAANALGRETAIDVLTARELQIATLVCFGRLNKQIAAQLKISEHTVNTHLRRVYSKLGVNNRAAMVFLCASLLERSQLQFQAAENE